LVELCEKSENRKENRRNIKKSLVKIQVTNLRRGCVFRCARQVYSSLQISSGTIRIKGMRNDKSGCGTKQKGNGMKRGNK